MRKTPGEQGPRSLRLFGFLGFGRFFGPGGFFALIGPRGRGAAASLRTVSGALGAIAARTAMGSVPVGFFAFSFACFLTASFGATAAFFGLLFFLPGFGGGRGFDDRQRSGAFDADF